MTAIDVDASWRLLIDGEWVAGGRHVRDHRSQHHEAGRVRARGHL